MTQLSFANLTRTTDPAGSHDAAQHVARSGLANAQQSECLAAVVRWPGRTASELCGNAQAKWGSKLTRYDYGRRLPELRERGLIRNGPARKCKATGMKAMVWECA